MGIELARAFVTVRGDTSKIASDLRASKAEVASAAQEIASTINNVLSMVGISIGFGALFSQSREAISLAERQINAEMRVAAMVKATGMAAGFTAEQLKKMASDMQASTRFGDESVLESMAILLQFKSVTGDVFKGAMATMLDMSEVMGTSLPSAAMILGRALEDPTQGMFALRRAGIVLTERQRDYIKQLAESNRLTEAQAYLLSLLREKVGGVSQAMALTPAGKLQQTRNVFGDMMEEMGKKLMKFQIQLTILRTHFIVAVSAAIQPFVRWLTAVFMTLSKMPEPLKEVFKWLVVLSIVIGVVRAAMLAWAMATKVVTATIMFLKGVSSPWGWAAIVVGITAATGAIVYMNSALSDAYAEVDKVGESFDKMVEKMEGGKEIKKSLDDILAGLKGADKDLMPGLKGVKSDLKDIKNVLTDIKDLTPIDLPGYEPKQEDKGLRFLERVHKAYNKAIDDILSLQKQRNRLHVIAGHYAIEDFLVPQPKGGYKISERLFEEWRKGPYKGKPIPPGFAFPRESFAERLMRDSSEAGRAVYRYLMLREVFASFKDDPKVAAEALGKFQNRLADMNVPARLGEVRAQLDALAAAGLYTKGQVEELWRSFFEESPFGRIVQQIEDVEFEVKALAEGWDDARIELEKFARQKWVEEDQIEEMSKAISLREKLKIGARIKEEIKGPAEETKKLISDIRDLLALREIGMGGLTKQEAVKRLEMEREKIERELPQPRPTLEAGRFGFADFERALQDALLRKDDPAKRTAQNTAEMKALLANIDETIQDLKKKMQQGPGVFGD